MNYLFITTYYWIDIKAFKSILNRIDIESNCDLKNRKSKSKSNRIVRSLTIPSPSVFCGREELLLVPPLTFLTFETFYPHKNTLYIKHWSKGKKEEMRSASFEDTQVQSMLLFFLDSMNKILIQISILGAFKFNASWNVVLMSACVV